MMIVIDPITLANLFFCIVIIIITIYGYYRIQNPTVLYIGAGFGAFGISHIATFLEMQDMFEPYLIIIRALGYILVIIGSYFIILEVIRRIDAENQLRKSYQQIEEQVQERTIELKLANSVLMDSEVRLNSIVHGSPMLQFVIDKDHQVISWNTVIEVCSGIKETDILGTSDQWKPFYNTQQPVLADLVMDDNIEQLPEWNQGKIKKSRFVKGAYEVIDFFPKMGESGKWLFFTAAPLRNINGTMIGVVGTLEDITNCRETQEALMDSEARLNSIVHGSPMLQFVIDKDHRVISWNKAIEECSGVKEAEVLGTRNQWMPFYDTQRPTLADLLVDEKIELVPEWYQGEINKSPFIEGSYETTNFFPKMGESGKWLYFSAAPIRNVNGIIIGAVETLEDITRQKEAEEALKENEEKFISIFEGTPDPIMILNSMYQIIEVNRVFEEMYECSNEDVTGKNLDDLDIGLTRQSIDSVLKKMREDSHIFHGEMSLVKRNGAPFIAEVAIFHIIIHSEPCLIVQIHDIDEIRRAHDAIAQVNHKLQVLSSITRHDILNRIMITSFYSKELINKIKDQNLQKHLEAIYTASGEIQTLIEFTAHYQNLGTTAPDWQQVEMILKHQAILGLLTGVTLTSKLGSLQIYADMMLEKVMYNLVENSVRHGQDLTSIWVTCHEEAGDMVIWYEDDGGGIIGDEKEKAFGKGFGKNTGLGLFLIREILSITGISINETGEPGVGVRFEIRIPAGKFRIS